MKIKFLQILLTAGFLGFGHHVLSQQQVMFTQYMFNGLAINPAYAGSHEAVSMTALVRQQWVGLEGAPNTQTFSIHTPIKEKKIALGFLFLHDKIGITDGIGIFRYPIADKKLNDRISYQIKLSKEGYLGKSTVFNDKLSQPGEISLHKVLNINLDKIDVGTDIGKLINVQPIYFDLGKYNIRSDAAQELDKIVRIMQENRRTVFKITKY